MFAPLTYGNAWTQDSCKMVKLFDTWDFDCNTFHTDVSTKYPLDSTCLVLTAHSTHNTLPRAVNPGGLDHLQYLQSRHLHLGQKATP